MKRKKWSPQTEVNEVVLRSREKRKWQIALRRYVLERNPASAYAPYFGLEIEKFRNWIEIQFDEGMDRKDFGEKWQFGFIMPLSYFDFERETDLKLCWNFINIRVQNLDSNKNPVELVDVIAAKNYFKQIFSTTGYLPSKNMVEKIEEIESRTPGNTQNLEGFIALNKIYLDVTSDFGSYEFEKLNAGVELKEIMKERAFLNKFR